MKYKNYFLFVGILLVSPTSLAVEFDTDFMHGVSENNKVGIFQKDFIDGSYLVDVFLNNKNIGRKTVFLKDANGNVCVNKAFLNESDIRIKSEYINEIIIDFSDCIYLNILKDASINFDVLSQNLMVSIPQLYLDSSKETSETIDYGVNGFKLNYNLNYRAHSNENSDKHQAFGRFSGNVNIGKWVGLYNFYGDIRTGISNINGFAFRALPEYASSLYLGRLVTRSSLQDDFSFDGVTLRSDLDMKSGNALAYSPIVQGYANSNAKVIIRQGNSVLRSESVPPGPFLYDDLVVSSNEDIVVTVVENNGEENSFNVPVTTLPNMIRHNEYEYDVSIGKRLKDDFDDGVFARAIYNFGLNRNTFNTELLINPDYTLIGGGVTRDMGAYGAMSLTSSLSYAKDYLSNDRLFGKSIALSYAKQLTSSTNMQIIGYRFTDENYVSFSAYNKEFMSRVSHAKNYYQIVLRHTFNNELPIIRSLNIEAWKRDFWTSSDETIGGSLNLYANINRLSVNLSTSYNKVVGRDSDVNTSLNVSFPLNLFDNDAYFNSGVSHSNNTNDVSYRASASTQLSDTSSYAISTYRTRNNHVNTLNANYDLSYVNLGLSLSDDDYRTTANMRLSGSVTGVTEHDKLIYDRSTNDTILVINAKEANNLKVNGKSIKSGNDNSGIVNLSPYRDNGLRFDTSKVDENIQLHSYDYALKPSRYALLYKEVDYSMTYNYMLKISNSQNAPFGSFVKDDTGSRVGFVSTNGIVQLSTTTPMSYLIIENDGVDTCKINMDSIPTLSDERKVQNVTCE